MKFFLLTLLVATISAQCDNVDIVQYSDADCATEVVPEETTADDTTEETTTEETTEETVDPNGCLDLGLGMYSKSVCDATTMTTTFYTDDTCETVSDLADASVTTFDECQNSDDGTSFKVTNDAGGGGMVVVVIAVVALLVAGVAVWYCKFRKTEES